MNNGKQKSQIVFVNQSSGYLMIDIVEAFSEAFDERILFTGFLNPRDKEPDPAVVIQKLIRYDRNSKFKRILTWGLGFIKSLWLIKTKYRKAELFLVSNPPMALLIPLFCKNTFRLLIYDVYPDALVNYKMVGRNSILVKWWSKANRKVYSRAKRIYTIGKGMKNLISAYVDSKKIELVPLWTDNSYIIPISKSENPLLNELHLEGRFVVLYSGNLGRTQEIEVLLELAEKIKIPEIFFLIIGQGERFDYINEKIKYKKLTNIRILPWQPNDKLALSLSLADIAVVSLGKQASHLSIPSKTFNYLSVGAPLLCIASENSELAVLVEQYGIGRFFEPYDIKGMVDFILSIKEDEVKFHELKKKSLETSKLFSSSNAFQFI